MTLKNMLGCSASVLALALVAGPALAQATDNEPVETVVVSGVRASLKSAQEIKKNSDQIVDSIVAEDIGKLPDNTVVDALQHVTGLQVQHGNGTGENDQIWVHGLPDIATTLNGREIFTTTGRYVSLADIPSELLQRLDVHKTAQAQDLEGGLSGLIDIRLHRPFDFDGLQVVANAKGTYGTLAKHVDPDGSLLVSNRWNTSIGEIGVLIDASYIKRHYIDEDAFNYWSYSDLKDSSGTVVGKQPNDMGGIQYVGNRERFALNVSTQWRPNNNTEFFAEVLYNTYRNPNSHEYLLLGGSAWSDAVSDYTTVTDPAGNVEMKTETNPNGFSLTSNQAQFPMTNAYQAAIGGSWTGDNLTVTSEINYTDSKYKLDEYIMDTAFWATTTMDTNYNNQGTPNAILEDDSYDPLDATNYHPTQFFDQWTRQSGNEFDWRADASYEVGSWIRSVDFGVRYANRYGKNRQDWGGAISCYSSTDNALGTYSQALHDSGACNGGSWWANDVETAFPGMMKGIDRKFFSGSGKSWDFDEWMVADGDYMKDHIKEIRAWFGQSTDAPAADLSDSFGDRELSYAGYAKVNFNSTIYNMPLTGNIGLRLVDTESHMTAYDTDEDDSGTSTVLTYTSVDVKGSDLAWMPSLNAKLAVQDNLIVHLGLSRTITRPTFSQLNPGMYLSYGGLTYGNEGSAGNWDLKPVKSDNVDLSLEYYYSGLNMVSGALFYRHIDGYIQSRGANETYGGVSYLVSRPYNSGMGFLQGMELGVTQWFDMLPGILNGLGLQVNGTFIEGHFRDLSSSDIEPYSGVSKYSFNVIPMYEKGPVSVRLSYNWRSSYQVGYSYCTTGSINPCDVHTRSYGELGASASYTIGDHLVVTLDATNIGNSIYQDFYGKGAWQDVYPRDTRNYGRTFSFGVRYKM
jgi:TonB-dependent receptor